MIKSKKSRVHRKQGKPPQVLELRVHSRRLLWIGLTEWLGKLFKLVLIGGAAAGLVWAAGLGLRRAFLDNSDFRIALIDLNENPVLDELRLIEVGGIDLEQSIFKIGVTDLEARLAGLPELALAKVERELPGTLRVRVQARAPVAWMEVPAHGSGGGNRLLVDPNGVLFHCLGKMVETTDDLPVIVIGEVGPEAPQAGQLCGLRELQQGLAMLRQAKEIPGMDKLGIARIEQTNVWSVRVTTAGGVAAVFGLRGHRRQFTDLVTACSHATAKGYRIATIDLIPERNIPITLGSAPPPRAVPVPEPAGEPGPAPAGRRRDMQELLNRG
jgi:cell division septal protein FtsQ